MTMKPGKLSQEPVVFRVWNRTQGGGVIALFPAIDEGRGLCSSYEHVGQHGGADYWGVVSASRPATADDYAELKRELESLGYDLRVYARRPSARQIARSV